MIPEEPTDDGTGLPWLHTWRGVYLFVLTCFVSYVALLALFTWMFA